MNNALLLCYYMIAIPLASLGPLMGSLFVPTEYADFSASESCSILFIFVVKCAAVGLIILILHMLMVS